MTSVVACPSCAKRNRVPASGAGRPRCASCHSDLPWIVEASAENFAAAVATDLPVLVDLWAPWCGPCRMVAPAVEKVAGRMAGSLKVVKLNVDEAPAVSARYGVQSIPTLLLLRDGREVARQLGAVPADRLLAWVEANAAQRVR